MTNCACLTGKAAALNGSDDIELALSSGYAEGLIDDELKGLEAEIFVKRLAVNGDNTGAGYDTYASYGLLSSAGTVEVRFCTLIHCVLSPFDYSAG